MKPMRMFCAVCALMLLCAVGAVADGQGQPYQDPPPEEVLAHLAEKYPNYQLEDYIRISGTPRGDYGFALAVKQGSRRLLGYRLKEGRMAYWMRNDGAAPQGETPAAFFRHSVNTCLDEGQPYPDSLGFSIYRLDAAAREYTCQEIAYHYERDGFKLMSYFDRDYDWIRCLVDDDGVSYREFLAGDRAGYVPGVLQRDIRYVNFGILPKTIQALKDSLSHAPRIPAGELTGRDIRFTGGRKYPVYAAPFEDALRAGGGKALVSTNDWIQVFGQENGFLLIQYDIASDHMRFGYIDAAALPRNDRARGVKALAFDRFLVRANTRLSLTDDPLFSQAPLGSIPAGAQVVHLAAMGGWAYVETTINGLTARGFVPSGSLSEVQTAVAPVQSLTAGQVYAGRHAFGSHQATVAVSLSPDQAQYELMVFLDSEAALTGQAAAPLPQCFHQLSGSLSLMHSLAPDIHGGTAAYLLPIPVSPGQTSVTIAPEYPGSGIALDQAAGIPLR